MALSDGKPIPDNVLAAMEAAAKARGRPYDDYQRIVLRCKNCWVTPIGAGGTPSLDPAQQTGFFAITPCNRHGGPVLGRMGSAGA